jgi:hypothetical protein
MWSPGLLLWSFRKERGIFLLLFIRNRQNLQTISVVGDEQCRHVGRERFWISEQNSQETIKKYFRCKETMCSFCQIWGVPIFSPNPTKQKLKIIFTGSLYAMFYYCFYRCSNPQHYHTLPGIVAAFRRPAPVWSMASIGRTHIVHTNPGPRKWISIYYTIYVYIVYYIYIVYYTCNMYIYTSYNIYIQTSLKDMRFQWLRPFEPKQHTNIMAPQPKFLDKVFP